ncbi:C6 transcription factor-like protein [Plenodomus tracheiphilus IPT5]|uniref:C6 transcription factor-like protein n=1 Tax=Plenodomus tracheiphilus IPT5 TaxID=1408161 RepID=A0A6A7B051_9PLEO|nr:C6 transcription factor-like protein [Plenodomus tracheiphilus IPT5]
MSSHAVDHLYQPGYASTTIGQRKVAIPRLQKVGQGQGVTKDRRRVPRACTGCRSHKIKCTGERPQCKHCVTTSRECVYIMPRKDRLKIVTERCSQMAGLLKTLKANVGVEDSARIVDILESVEEDISELHQTAVPSNAESDTYGSQESRDYNGEDQDNELDTYSLDLLDENLHENDRARATGFVGGNSEVQWLRAVASAHLRRTDDETTGPSAQRRESCVPSCEQVSSFSFWADGENVDLDIFIAPYDLPQPEVAERLLHCYMLKAHDSFPILARKPFEDQFRIYFRAVKNGNAPVLSPKWQAILNLVFAIGARYSHLVKANWRADDRDHLIYQARARAFGLTQTTFTSHSDIPQIQSLGLLAFYWLSVGQVSRAWTIIGMAIRAAYSLGLHVRNEDPSATAVKRETLVRTWWSLYSLERTLSIITGRPSIIVDSYCSVPLPVPIPEENISGEVEAAYRMRKRSTTMLYAASPTFSASSHAGVDVPNSAVTVEANSGSYFRAVVQLSVITQNILTSLYSAGTSLRTSNDIQQDTMQLVQRLDQWVTALLAEFNSQDPTSDLSEKFTRERMLLGFQFCSARILLTRPNLTARRQPWKEAKEANFSKCMSNMCIEAAKTIVASLPDDPRPELIYDQGPWWCIVHHLMQAISIFLLELSYTSQGNTTLVYFVKKALHWLEAMQDPIAQRAHKIALDLFQTVARRQPSEISSQWAVQTQQTVAGFANIVQPARPDSMLDAYYPTQYVSMAPQTADSSYPAYDTVTNIIPYSMAPILNQDYYMAR